MAFNLTRRDAVVLIASTLALGCSQKAKAPVSAIDLSRFRFNSLLFNDQEVVAGDDALSVTAGDVFIIQGAGKIAAGYTLPPKDSGKPISLSAPAQRKNTTEEKMMGLDFWFAVVDPEKSIDKWVIHSAILNSHPDRHTIEFDGELDIPKSPGTYEIHGYAMWIDLDARMPGGMIEPERHLVFQRALQVK